MVSVENISEANISIMDDVPGGGRTMKEQKEVKNKHPANCDCGYCCLGIEVGDEWRK